MVDAAAEAAATVAAVEEGASSMTTCTSKTTPEERSKCVDELRVTRRGGGPRVTRSFARMESNGYEAIT